MEGRERLRLSSISKERLEQEVREVAVQGDTVVERDMGTCSESLISFVDLHERRPKPGNCLGLEVR
jgi:hypothetical protein